MELLLPSPTQESCAPSPCAERVLQPSRGIRYQAAVSPRAIPGRKRTGKTAVLIPWPCGPGAQRVGLQTGESGGWASCGRQGAPGQTRPGSPRNPAQVRSPTGGVRPLQRWRQCCASPGAPEQVGVREGQRAPQTRALLGLETRHLSLTNSSSFSSSSPPPPPTPNKG